MNTAIKNTLDRWFYTESVTFNVKGGSIDNNTGLYIPDSKTQSFTTRCNIQPIDTTKDFDENGKLIDAEFKVFCQPNELITLNATVDYNGANYTITKMDKWKSEMTEYVIVFIKEVK